MVRSTAALIALAAAVAAMGCGDLGADEAAGCAVGDATCRAGTSDAGATFADVGPRGPSPDAAGPPASYDRNAGIPASSSLESAAASRGFAENADGVGSCYDGDASGGADDALADCADPYCALVPSCCVGSAECCGPMASPPLPAALPLEGDCPGDPTASCLAGLPVTGFGDPGPWVREGRLHPGGDDSYDSGLVIGGDIDLTTMRARVDTQLHMPADPCTGACLEGAGIAFTAQTAFGDNTHVEPLAGLFVSGPRNEVVLLVGDRIAHRWTASEIDPTDDWTLVLRPSGTVEVTHGGETVPAPFPLSDRARLVVYGRNLNPSSTSGPGASISDVTMSVSVCDMPTAWRDRQTIAFRTLGGGDTVDSGTMRSPSVAWDGTRLVMAYQSGAEFHLAGRGGDDLSYFVMRNGAPVLDRAAHAGATVSDPELVRGPADEWWLFYTVTDAAGAKEIWRATVADPSMDDFVPDAAALVSPAGEVDGWSMPAVLVHSVDAARYVIMIARADLATGGHQLRVLLSTDDGVSFYPFSTTALPELTTPGGIGSAAADADEIAAPSLVIYRGAYHLYFASRRGTRWSIGMIASDELVLWRDVNEGVPVLTADGNGRDRLSVRDPEVFAQDTQVQLFYTGNDGARDAIFRAWRVSAPAPTEVSE